MNTRIRPVRAAAAALLAGMILPSAGVSLKDVLSAHVLPKDWDAPSASTAAAVLREVDRADVACDEAWKAIRTKADYDRHRLALREKMYAAIGTFPERTPLNARVVGTVRNDGYRVEKVIFESMPGVCVTANLFIPDGAVKRPAVVMSCGHSELGKDCLVYLRACVLAVKRGFVAFMFDPYAQGERVGESAVIRSSTRMHTQIGIRANLLDWSIPLLRIWDGMRAIDYVQSRPEADPEKIGYMGQSGGGTMTALMETADPRIRAACPSCYLTSLRALCATMGPQDGEQNIFGQLAFGLNHTGYVLVPDIPIAVTAKFGDMFPFTGVQSLFATVRALERNLGLGDRAFLNVAQGPHGWVESTERTSVDFLARQLLPDCRDLTVDLAANRMLDFGFDIDTVDLGLKPGERGCTPDRHACNLPGARKIMDVIAERAAAKRRARPSYTPAQRDALAVRLAGVVRPADGERMFREYGGRDCGARGTASNVVMVSRATAEALPAVLVVPKAASGREPVLLASFGPRTNLLARAQACLDEGRPVLVADVSGVGEVGAPLFTFYGHKERPDEGLGAMCYLLGQPLVGKRAGDLLAFGDFLAKRFGARPKLIVEGPLAIAAAHALAADRTAWSGLEFADGPDSWRELLENPAKRDRYAYYADLVPRAYLHYDWTDLVTNR